jgi:RNA recognition motif-containing protein
MNIYVGQLPGSITETKLRDLFAPFGDIAGITLITDRFSGRPKDFGFVDMPDNSQADKAIKALNRSQFEGKEIKVNQVQIQKGKKRQRRRPSF